MNAVVFGSVICDLSTYGLDLIVKSDQNPCELIGCLKTMVRPEHHSQDP